MGPLDEQPVVSSLDPFVEESTRGQSPAGSTCSKLKITISFIKINNGIIVIQHTFTFRHCWLLYENGVEGVSGGVGGTQTKQTQLLMTHLFLTVWLNHILFLNIFTCIFLVLSNRWEMNRLTTRLWTISYLSRPILGIAQKYNELCKGCRWTGMVPERIPIVRQLLFSFCVLLFWR